MSFNEALHVSPLSSHTPVVSDDHALERALQAAIDRRVPAVIESRTYQLTRRISLSGGPLIVQGTIGLSVLSWTLGDDASDAGIALWTSRDLAVPVCFSGVSLVVDGHATTPALFVDYSGTIFPTSPEPWGVFRDLTIKGSRDPFTSSWAKGLSILNGNRICISDVAVNGGIVGTEPNYVAGSRGVHLYRNRPSAGIYVDHLEVMHCEEALDASDYEGIVVTRSALVGNRRGVHVHHSDTFPHVSITDTHCNSFGECIRVENAAQILLRNNPLHLRSPDPYGAAIRVTGNKPSWDSVISGNSVQNYGPLDKTPIGIAAESMLGGIISDNTIAGCAVGTWIAGGSRGVLMPSGTFRQCGRALVDAGVKSKIGSLVEV